MRANPNDILIWTMTRSVLVKYAEMIAHLNDMEEARRLRETLIGELQSITPNAALPEIWKQAVKGMSAGRSDLASYALDRLGLWPGEKDGDH